MRQNERLMVTVLIIILTITGLKRPCFAQEDQKLVKNTSNTDIYKKAPPKPNSEKSEKALLSIVKNDTKEILYGNKCVEEVANKMGFKYLVIPKGNKGNLNGFNRFFHNLGVKFIITIKNGPFWKSKIKKRIRDCRNQSGDFTG